jgi:hypothetical protein
MTESNSRFFVVDVFSGETMVDNGGADSSQLPV